METTTINRGATQSALQLRSEYKPPNVKEAASYISRRLYGRAKKGYIILDDLVGARRSRKEIYEAANTLVGPTVGIMYFDMVARSSDYSQHSIWKELSGKRIIYLKTEQAREHLAKYVARIVGLGYSTEGGMKKVYSHAISNAVENDEQLLIALRGRYIKAEPRHRQLVEMLRQPQFT